MINNIDIIIIQYLSGFIAIASLIIICCVCIISKYNDKNNHYHIHIHYHSSNNTLTDKINMNTYLLLLIFMFSKDINFIIFNIFFCIIQYSFFIFFKFC
jgi:glycerol uptake facilitator-like aquaporin